MSARVDAKSYWLHLINFLPLQVFQCYLKLLTSEDHWYYITYQNYQNHNIHKYCKVHLGQELIFKEKIPTVPLIFQFDIRHHCCVWYFEKWSCIFFLELNIFSQWLQGISTPSTWCASICLMMSVASPSFQHTLQVLPSFCLFLILNFLWLFSIIDLTVSSKCCKSADTGIDMANALFSILLRSSICSFLVVPEYDIFWFVLYFCVCLVCISVSLD